MEIIILGSGTGVPTKRRSAPGLVVKIDHKNILFDSGSGVIYQMARAGIDYRTIHDIFYTHIFHPDHVNDLTALLFANKYDHPQRKKALQIIGPPGMRNFYANIRRLFPIFEKMPFPIDIREVGNDQIMLGSISVISKPLWHQGVDCVGYRIEYGGKAVIYTGDTDYCPNVSELAMGADLLISECSFPEELKVDGHLTPKSAGKIAAGARIKKLLLTHFYPPCDHYDIKGKVKEVFPGEVILAEDLMRVEV